MDRPVVLVRGAGDLASGVALRLYRAGVYVLMTEIAAPLAVRRTVSFSEAVYEGWTQVEGITARFSRSPEDAVPFLVSGEIPVLVDPELTLLQSETIPMQVSAVVDARLLKKTVPPVPVEFVIGLGPGFIPGMNCDAVVETMRGHTLGRVYRDRPALGDTGLPDGNPARVLRSPLDGVIIPSCSIADQVEEGDVVAMVKGIEETASVRAAVSGVVRGMLREGTQVGKGLKIGDIDERGDPSYCFLVSDKSLAIGGGVLEAILSRQK